MSGVRVDDECMTAFQELKKKSIGYVIYGLDPKLKRVEVKEKGSFASYDDFLDKVPKNDAAFVVVDFEYSKGEGEAKRRKIILISWGPEGIGSKIRMVQASTYNTLRNMLDGVGAYVQATDLSDIEYDELASRC